MFFLKKSLRSISIFLLLVAMFFSSFVGSVNAVGGVDWTVLIPGVNTGIKFSTTNANSVAYGAGKFVAVGDGANASYSSDGINWTILPPGQNTGIKLFAVTVQSAYSITYGGDKFVVVGSRGSASYSSDGINWTALASGVNTGIKFGTNTAAAIAYGNGMFVVAGAGGLASYSSDGINWTALTPGVDTGIKFGNTMANSVTYGNGKFIVGGSSGMASYSSDGINWTALTPGCSTGISQCGSIVSGIAYGSGIFVAVGGGNESSYSSDGITWIRAISVNNNYSFYNSFGSGVGSIVYSGDKFVAVGGRGKAAYSSDGINWTTLTAGDNTGIKFGTSVMASAMSVAYGGSTFVVVGAEGRASYSSSVMAPTITSSSATSITTTGATLNGDITATGGEDNTIRGFEYGLTTAYGTATSTTGSYGTGAYTATLTGLSSETLYHYRAFSTNSAGTATSTDQSFTTLDNTTPNLSAITSATTSSSASITWTTNEIATSRVEYGPSTSYGDLTIISNLSGTTTHSVTLPNLVSCTNYHYRVISADLSDNTATSSDYAFSIGGCTGDSTVIASTTVEVTTASGATLEVAGLTLDVPANYTATSSTATFQAKILTGAEFFTAVSAPSSFSPVGDYIYNLEALINATTTLTTFSLPLTITISYDPATLGSITESSLVIYRYDAPTWTPLSSCSVNTTLHTVTCTTTNFSDFGLFGQVAVARGGTSGGTSYGCKDPKATNYEFFSSHRQSLCQYAQLAAVTPVIVPSATTGPVTNSGSIFTRDLKLGIISDDVKLLQQYLNSHGFTVASSGPGSSGNETTKFGFATQASLIKFQKANNIVPAVGYFGPKTRALITTVTPVSVITTPVTEMTVSQFIELLITLGVIPAEKAEVARMIR